MFKSILHTESLKQAFEKSLRNDKIQLTQITSSSGVAIIISSLFMDMWAIPSSLYEAILLRAIVVSVLLLTLASTFYPSFFIKNYTKLLVTAFLLTAFSFEYSIYLAKITELAYYTYFAGLTGIFMILYSWTYISTKNLLITTLAIIGGYVLAIVMREEQGPNGPIPLLIVTLSILTGIAFVGFVGRLVRDRHHHEKFLLQQSLKASVKEKSKEADAHEYYANHDILTGLPNRRFAENNLDTKLLQINQLNMLMVVMFLDLNGFKKINDDYGHDAGDEVLKVTADRLQLCINKKDTLIRLGGDEFLICLTIEEGEVNVIENIVNRIRTSITKSILFEGNKLDISTSIGVAISEKDGDELNTLIAVADKRMYQDKVQSKKVENIPDNIIALSFAEKSGTF